MYIVNFELLIGKLAHLRWSIVFNHKIFNKTSLVFAFTQSVQILKCLKTVMKKITQRKARYNRLTGEMSNPRQMEKETHAKAKKEERT
jgi:hypothetical protein